MTALHQLYAGTEINLLAHRPRWLIAGGKKSTSQANFLPAKIRNCLFVSHIHLPQYFIKIIAYDENKLKENRVKLLNFHKL